MAGTKIGGLRAAATNKAKHGAGFYAMIGQKGGRNGHTGGFAANPDLARIAGKKGGRISRRRRKGETEEEYMRRRAALNLPPQITVEVENAANAA